MWHERFQNMLQDKYDAINDQGYGHRPVQTLWQRGDRGRRNRRDLQMRCDHFRGVRDVSQPLGHAPVKRTLVGSGKGMGERERTW